MQDVVSRVSGQGPDEVRTYARMNRDDEELLAAIRAGDDAAMGALLTRHAPAIYRFGVKMCRDSEDAKDVLQETLLAAARGVREFRGASSLSTWLYTIARSFCIKKRRASKFAPTDTVSLDDQAAALQPRTLDKGPEEATSDRELTALLNRAIASLDPTSREVLVLRDVEGLTAPEVAEVLGVSVNAVKSRLHRARAEVRAQLEAGLSRGERSSQRPAAGGCPDVVALFSRFLEGEIGAADCAAMQAHVAACARCGAACESLKRTLSLCRSEPRGEVPHRRTRARPQGAARLHRAAGEGLKRGARSRRSACSAREEVAHDGAVDRRDVGVRADRARATAAANEAVIPEAERGPNEHREDRTDQHGAW